MNGANVDNDDVVFGLDVTGVEDEDVELDVDVNGVDVDGTPDDVPNEVPVSDDDDDDGPVVVNVGLTIHLNAATGAMTVA